MSSKLLRGGLFIVALLGGNAARADFVSQLQLAPIAASSSVAFQDSNVTPGTTSPDGAYNFLDRWTFVLDGSFLVSSIAAAIEFRDASGQAVLFGVGNLQVNLVSTTASGPPLVSWSSVSAPATGLEQTVALIPPSALGAGSYALDVRGYVTQPGSYSGSLLAQPVQAVPLPASGALLFSGLLAMGFTASRSRRR